ncbi:MAG: DUF2244 domain-containing protein [Alphaproteobacteria bacterium]|nr:DUF2244 domain-containing protein [Alphaproteobacteria bacterium]
MERGNPKAWQAVLTPHRSLDQRGFLLLMGLIVAVNLVVGVLFLVAGAWPVAGFAGLDVLAIWLAFRANFTDAQQAERIVITEHELVFERVSRTEPLQTRRFVRRWVKVDLDEDQERELVGSLFLTSGRARISIGEFLSPGERKDLASRLRAALAIPRI